MTREDPVSPCQHPEVRCTDCGEPMTALTPPFRSAASPADGADREAGYRDGFAAGFAEAQRRANSPGRCLRHGYVTERCCEAFEQLPQTSYLRDAVRKAVGR